MHPVTPFVHISAPYGDLAQQALPDQLRNLKAKVAAIQEEIKRLENGQAVKGSLPMAVMQYTPASPTLPISPLADPLLNAALPPVQLAKRQLAPSEEPMKASKPKIDITQALISFASVQSGLVKLFCQLLSHQGNPALYSEILTLIPRAWDSAKCAFVQIKACMATLHQIVADPNFKHLSKDHRCDILSVQRIWLRLLLSLQSDCISNVIPTQLACHILGAKESSHRPLCSRLRIYENAVGNDHAWNSLIETLFLMRHSLEYHHEHLLQLLHMADEFYQDKRRFYGEILLDVRGSEVFYFSFTLNDLLRASPVAKGVPFEQMRELDWVWQAPQANLQTIAMIQAKRLLSQAVYRLFSTLERGEMQQAHEKFYDDFSCAKRAGYFSEIGMDLLQMLDVWLKKEPWLEVSINDKVYHFGITVDFFPLEIVTRYLFAPKKKPMTIVALMDVLQNAIVRYIPVQKCIGVIKQVKHTSQEFLNAIKELPISLYLHNPENPIVTITLAKVEAGGNGYLKATLQQAVQEYIENQVPDEIFWNHIAGSQ